MKLFAYYTGFTGARGTHLRDFAPAIPFVSRQEDLWEKRRKRKNIGGMVWLLQKETSRPIMYKGYRRWITVSDEDTEVKENRGADTGTGVGDSGAVPYPDQVSGKERTVPEAQIGGGQTPLVQAESVPLARPVGRKVRAIIMNYGLFDGRNKPWTENERRYDGVYICRRNRKVITKYLEERTTKEIGNERADE